MQIRKPAVAGMFYTADEHQLRRDVENLMHGAASLSAANVTITPKALIVPHAGYIYSGAVAASAYQLLTPLRESIQRVVLMGPAHRVYLQGMAIPSATQFQTPLGTIPLDQIAMENISQLPGVTISDAAHAQEHSLEVQLPFLQTTLSNFTLVPIVVGQCDAELVAGVVDTLWGNNETLIVISTDLSHFLNYSDAQNIDFETTQKILAKATTLKGHEACGANAINGFMRAANTGPLAIETINICNSGDTAGDKSKVVGYGAFVVY